MVAQPIINKITELTTAGLQLYLLGPPQVKWTGRAFPIPRRQTRALLYYLATWPYAIPREKLCCLFWPDIPESSARRNLSRLLTHLRRALPASDLLLIRDDHVELDPQAVWSDTVAFKRLRAIEDPNHQIKALQQAVDLYRGSFLAGFSIPDSPEFETWVVQEQIGWERLYLEALASLIEDLVAAGSYKAAIIYAQRYLAVDELAENIHRRLIEFYAITGNQSAAVRQFEQCAMVLERDLGISPLPETQAAYQAVLKGRSLLPPPSMPHPIPPPTRTTLPDPKVPLIERNNAKTPGQTAKHALQAGLAAKAIFAWAEAQAHFDRALVSLKQEAAYLREPEEILANRRLQIQSIAERGWVFRLLGDMEAYARDTQEIARLAELIGDQRTSAYLHWREAYSHRWFCRYPETRLAAEAGYHLSQAGIDPLLEAKCLREIGLAKRETGNYKQAQATLKQALDLFVGLGEVIEEIHTLGDLSTLYRYAGEYGQALALAQQALARCEAAQLPFERRRPLSNIGAAAASTDQVNLALQSLLESLSIARQINDYTQQIFSLGHLGWFCLKSKRPTQALEFLQTALALAEGIDSLAEQSWLLAGLAETHHLAGDLELAVEFARRALKLAHSSGRTYDRGLAHQILTKLR